MTTATGALVRLTMPQLDAKDDPVTVSLAYKNIAIAPSDVSFLVDQVPHLFTQLASGATNKLGTYIAASVDRGTDHCLVDVYDIGTHLDGSPHGSPVASGTWTMPAPASSSSLPAGVGAALSFRADYGSDVEFGAPSGVGTGHLRPRARDRGRIFVGPFVVTVVDSSSPTWRCHLTPTFITDALASLQQIALISDIVTLTEWSLSVWSRKDAALKVVTELWMDDRPDYQRRRSDPGNKTFRSAS